MDELIRELGGGKRDIVTALGLIERAKLQMFQTTVTEDEDEDENEDEE